MNHKQGWWEQWIQQPQRLWIYDAVFQIHFWVGVIVGIYIAFMSLTGSMIVFRNEISRWVSVGAIVKLHTNLMLGSVGTFVNGLSGISLTLLCATGAFIWWPGIKNWRRSLKINWSSHFARIQWDLHSALGFWFFLFVLLWGISGTYLAAPNWFAWVFDPSNRALFWLSELHFGRFNHLTEAVWVVVGLVPGILTFTGVFVCCRRVIYKKPSNPNR